MLGFADTEKSYTYIPLRSTLIPSSLHTYILYPSSEKNGRRRAAEPCRGFKLSQLDLRSTTISILSPSLLLSSSASTADDEADEPPMHPELKANLEVLGLKVARPVRKRKQARRYVEECG